MRDFQYEIGNVVIKRCDLTPNAVNFTITGSDLMSFPVKRVKEILEAVLAELSQTPVKKKF